MPSSNSATSAAAAQASGAAAPPSAHAVVGGGGGDNDSAALLWTLRANAVTPSKPTASSSSSTSAAVGFTTPTTSSSAPHSTNAALSSTPLSASKAVGVTPLSATRRGPGRPKKSESNSKNAAKWDDTVTALLLKFRYDDMRHEFEGVRNNVEVGECWIQLAQTISRLSGKSFDSHQCQSKLRNLKKSWREMSSSSRVVASATSPLYPLLNQYLGGGENTNAASATTTAANSSRNNNESTEAGPEVPEPRGFDASSRRISSGATDETERVVEVVVSDSEGGRNAIGNGDRAQDVEDETHRAVELSSSAVEENTPVADLSLEVIGADDDVIEAETNQSTRERVTSKNPVTSRSRSDSLSSSSSSSFSSAPAPSKRQKTSSSAPTASAASDTAADTPAPTSSTIIATAAAPILSGGLLQTGGGRIDSSLLSVANGLRTMMEGVIASKEESSEQQSILAELREHNALMKRYCEEVNKQTTSLNALIDLLTAKFGNQ